MARLVYFAIASLDGYVEDDTGRFDWAAPDEEVHRFVNDLERPVGTYLYGRRMYDTMTYWETAPDDDSVPAPVGDYGRIWRAADKVVYSRSLTSVTSGSTRLERSFDADAVRALKEASARDLTVGGAELAGQAVRAGLVDELQLLAVPVVVGGGKPWLPSGARLALELLETRSFRSGVVFLRYEVRPPS